MTFDELYDKVGDQPFFDLAMVTQISGEPRPSLRVQLHRWVKHGKLLHLRRGMYAWPERYQKIPLNPAEAANALHAPSYLSGVWAMGYYGMIPEAVFMFTSVTSRCPRKFENAAGTFEYRHLKQEYFFGYQRIELVGSSALIALPEKALLDFLHLSEGPWPEARMREMRFQNFETVNEERLDEFAGRFHSPRILKAVKLWKMLASEDKKAWVTL